MDYEQIRNVEGDKDMKKLKEEVISLNNDEELVKLFSDEEEEKLYINTMKQVGYDEGIEKGIEQGIEQNTIEMVKKMLAENADIKFISKVSGLSTEEIENLK